MEMLVIAAFAAVIAIAFAARWWMWHPVVRRRVIVQTDGAAFDAVLMSRRGQLLVLADVILRTGEATRPVDGQVVVERSRVQWVQVID